MPRYKLIAVDVDGTLLTSQGAVSVRTRAALGRAIQGGAALAVATGRRRRSALPIMERLGLPHFLAASQGATVWQDDSLLFHSHFPAPAARIALDIIRRHGLVTVIFGSALQEEVIWVDGDWHSNERIVRYLEGRGSNRPMALMREFTPEALEHDPIQFLLMDTMEKLERVNEALTGHVPPPAPSPAVDPPLQDGPSGNGPLWKLIFSRNQFTAGGAIEVLGPTTSKAAALGFLCARLGITRERVIAFGDNVNDVEMLQFAGLGVAMGNATDDARAAAARTAPSNDEDGIAAVLEEVGLA